MNEFLLLGIILIMAYPALDRILKAGFWLELTAWIYAIYIIVGLVIIGMRVYG